MRKPRTSPKSSQEYSNPIITLWRHFGCNLPPDMFDSIFQAIWLNWQMKRARKKFRKSLSPEKLKYLDAQP